MKHPDPVAVGFFLAVSLMIIAVLYAFLIIEEDTLGIELPKLPTLSGEAKENINETESKIIGTAVATKNASLCEGLKVKKEECYEALMMSSEEACVKVSDYEKKKECIEYFAGINSSTAICNALNSEDIHACKLLADPCYNVTGSEREYCQALAYQDYNYCTNDDCIYDYAIETKSYEACNSFNVSSMKIACSSLVEDWNRCKQLALASEQDHCNYIFAVKTEDTTYCAVISENSIYKYMCYVDFMLKENNYSYCDGVSFNDKWDCLINYSLTTGNVSGCDNIDDDAINHKEECYFNYAVKYYQPKVCEELSMPSSKDSCYAQSIMDMSKPLPYENCEDMENPTWKDKCYKYSAIKNNDIAICGFIENVNTNALCVEQVNAS